MRSSLAEEPELQTMAERTGRVQLEQLDSDYQERRAALLAELEVATRLADDVRDPLLYGSGTPLVDAVAHVLADAKIAVQDLDELLGETSNADLIAEYGPRRVLVEVKSSGGAAGERLAEAPARHLATWHELRPDLPVDGVVLVLNHQTKLHPLDRETTPYRRAEFVAALSFPVVTTGQLYDWWRDGDSDAVRAAIFGSTIPVAAMGQSSTGAQPSPNAPQTISNQSPPGRKRWRLFRAS
jgi:hypothetical protein